MFKINSLTMVDNENQSFVYYFKEGLNYLKGKNSSGKTEFYKFLDYMFGASFSIYDKPWYKGTLSKGIMEFEYNNIVYRITRTINTSVNYFAYSDESDGNPINLEEYKDKLNAIFSVDKQTLRRLHDFTDEELTYRTFTVFNFLGEVRQGVLVDFFDKCDDIKYSLKMTSILNFIFNKNPERIYELKKMQEQLKKEIRNLEYVSNEKLALRYKINLNLHKLNLGITYNGSNTDLLKKKINELKNMEDAKASTIEKSISELEVVFNNLEEQIKVYENRKSEMKIIQHENENRELLLEKLKNIIANNDNFNYLVEPLISLVDDLKNSISFNKYVINDDTVKKLKQQKTEVKEEILKSNNKFVRYNLNEKARSIAIIEDCLSSYNVTVDNNELENMKKKLNEIKEELKYLSTADNVDKVNRLSKTITQLYISTFMVSDFVQQDMKDNSFHIKYLKKGNSLQTMIIKKAKDELGNQIEVETVMPTGSLARHTLIQLCGYIAFLELLISENKYPIIPILVLDHISKPFDSTNPKAIGAVFEKAYSFISKSDLQTFIFDDDDYNNLGIIPDKYEELVNEKKCGFNPFYSPK